MHVFAAPIFKGEDFSRRAQARPTARARGTHHRMPPHRSDIAVCITGQLRDLLHPLVVAGYHEHVARPLRDPEIYVTLSDAVTAETALKVHREYGPATTIVDASGAQGGNMTFVLACKRGISYAGSKILRAWTSIGVCYDEIVQAELKEERSFRWLYRLRTDIVFLSDIFAPPAPDVVAVPRGGMTEYKQFRCMNDHMFACPRHLCRPYFHLLDLFRDTSPVRCTTSMSLPVCTASRAFDRLLHPPGSAAGDLQGAFHADDCRLPRPPRLDPKMPGSNPKINEYSEQWFYFWALGGALRDGWLECGAHVHDGECCGRLRERSVYYAISRGGNLECNLRLETLWADANETSPFFLERCRALPVESRRGRLTHERSRRSAAA